MFNLLKMESIKDQKQIMIFMIIYSFTCIACVANTFGWSYTLNNIILLIASAVPLLLSDNAKSYFFFAYASSCSISIDLFIIPYYVFIDDANADKNMLSFCLSVISSVVFVIVKFIISISEVQIGRHLAGQAQMRFRFKIDLFNYAEDKLRSQYYKKNARDDVVVNLTQITPNTTEVNQTSMLANSINNELKFEKHNDIEKHSVPK